MDDNLPRPSYDTSSASSAGVSPTAKSNYEFTDAGFVSELEALDPLKIGAVPAKSGGLTVKANLEQGVSNVQDISLEQFAIAISLGVTRANLSSFKPRLKSLRVSGYLTAGDAGEGAIYVSSDAPTGPDAIPNGLFWWVLVFPGDVYAGHFGAGALADSTSAMKKAIDYGISSGKSVVLPNAVFFTDQVKITWPTNGTPFAPGKLRIRGGGPGISVWKKIAGGSNAALLYLGDVPSSSIKQDTHLSDFSIDGRSPSETYAGLVLLDTWRGSLTNMEFVNCQFGYQTLGCIYISYINVNCHYNTYGAVSLKLLDSYFRPLVGPANIHTHINTNYNLNYNRGVIFDDGAMFTMLGCNVEYNGSQLGNPDHGGVYIGDNVGFALPGTTMVGVRLTQVWFENNYGLEQVRVGSGRTLLDGVQFIVPPGFSTVGVNRVGGVVTIRGGTVFAAEFAGGNVFDDVAATLPGNKITSDCALYKLNVKKALWDVERPPAQKTTAFVVTDAPIANASWVAVPLISNPSNNQALFWSASNPTRLTTNSNIFSIDVGGFVSINNQAGSGAPQGNYVVVLAKNGAYNSPLASQTVSVQSGGTGAIPLNLSTGNQVVDVSDGDYFEIYVIHLVGQTVYAKGGQIQARAIG